MNLEISLNKILTNTRIICIMILVASAVGLIVQMQADNWQSSLITLLFIVLLSGSASILSFEEFIWRRVIKKYATHFDRIHDYHDEKRPGD